MEDLMTPPRPAIAATGLRRSFGDQLVLDGIDLEVAEGTIFALLGPNGAGKTTIVQILSTLLGADAGTVRVAGHDPARDPDAVRKAIGVTGQFAAVDTEAAGRPAATYSGGMRRRLDIAMTLVGDPRIALALVGYMWARAAFGREPSPR
jgi:ABC-2 type transport system ATP-binding protein